MIIDNKQSDLQVFGDIKEFKTGIDPKNIELITTLLSSNLYSAPERSFIREIVSNAWDSHVEAGTTNIPVIIKFTSVNNGYDITVRDYGTGLSPERFKDVYCNIGSSTKRESNEFIGGFGIGKYSSLACSNTVYIASYYNNMAYYYIMVKDGNSIVTNLVNTTPTMEDNGVAVTIKNVPLYSTSKYIEALDYIKFFPNIYIDGVYSKVNDCKIKKFSNFAVSSDGTQYKLLLGNVLYPCDKSFLSDEAKTFLSYIEYTGIVIKFDVGELNITPNRESVVYTKDSISKINERVLNARDELSNVLKEKLKKDYTDIVEYYNLVNSLPYVNPFDEKVFRCDINITFDSSIEQCITYKGLWQNYKRVAKIANASLPNVKGVIMYSKIYSNTKSYRLADMCHLRSPFIVLSGATKMYTSVKQWLVKKYEATCIVSPFTKEELITHLKGCRVIDPDTAEDDTYIAEEFYDCIMNRAPKIDVCTNQEYLTFKDSLKSCKEESIPKDDLLLHIVHNRYSTNKKYFSTFNDLVDFIKSQKRGVVLIGGKDTGLNWGEICTSRGFLCIKAKKSIVDALQQLNLRCLVDKEFVIKTDPYLVKYATFMMYLSSDTLSMAYHHRDLANEGLNAKITMLYNFSKEKRSYEYESLRYNIKEYDSYIKSICIEINDFVNKIKEAGSLAGTYDHDIVSMVMLKTKSYRVSKEAYNKAKNNELIKLLCRK